MQGLSGRVPVVGGRGFVIAVSILVVAVGSLELVAPHSAVALSPSAPVHGGSAVQKDPFTFTSPKPQPSGFFGYATAISGTTVAVGAPTQNSTSQAYGGVVYLFHSTTGALFGSLSSPLAQKDDYFGFSVAISGRDVVVGAPLTNLTGATYGGRAYVFSTTGTLLATLSSPTPQFMGEFGYSVAILGTTIAVGSPGENVSGSTLAGQVYLFHTTGALFATLTSPDALYYGRANDSNFGLAVALGGTTLAVGAPGENAPGGVQAGHVYLYHTATGVLQQTLTSPRAQKQGDFGYSVATNGRWVVVGAANENTSGLASSGAAYVFQVSNGALLATLASANPVANGLFGDSVAMGATDMMVGAPFETAGAATTAGHAYVFSPAGALISTLTSPNAQKGGWFGKGVAILGIIYIVGAPNEASSGYLDAGNAYQS